MHPYSLKSNICLVIHDCYPTKLSYIYEFWKTHINFAYSNWKLYNQFLQVTETSDVVSWRIVVY